jgi:hypothetical protein
LGLNILNFPKKRLDIRLCWGYIGKKGDFVKKWFMTAGLSFVSLLVLRNRLAKANIRESKRTGLFFHVQNGIKILAPRWGL